MNRKSKFKLENVDLAIFDSQENIDEFNSVPKNSQEIEANALLYAELEYPIQLQKVADHHGAYWLAKHPDLPGCSTHGESKKAALINLDDAKKSWIYSALSQGMAIPVPGAKSEIEDCSGRILLRLPKELHYRLLQKAKEDDTSLNQELVFLISTALGSPSPRNKNL